MHLTTRNTSFSLRPLLSGLLSTVGLLATALPATFAQQETEPVTPDACVLELTLPPRATVTIDGKDFGAKRQFTYERLKPGSMTQTNVVVRFSGGGTEERRVWLTPGRRLNVSIAAPDPNRPELALQTGHSGGAGRAEFSSDGRYLLTANSNSPTAILWDVATGRQLRSYSKQTQGLRGIGLTPDGKRVMTASFDNSVIMWDRDTGRRLLTFEVESCYAAALSPDGRKVATSGLDKKISLYDALTGQTIRVFETVHNKPVGKIVFSPDGRRILSAAITTRDDRTVVLSDAATGRTLRQFAGHRVAIQSLAFSPDGRRALVVAVDAYREFDAQSNRNPDFNYSELVLWDCDSGTRLAESSQRTVDVDGKFGDAVFSPDGRIIYVVGAYAHLQVFDGATLARLPSIEHKFGAIEVSPDGRLLTDGSTVYDVETGRIAQTFGSRLAPVRSIDLTMEDEFKVLAARFGVLDLGGGQPLRRIEALQRMLLHEVQFADSGRRIVGIVGTVAAPNNLLVLDERDGSEEDRFPVASSHVYDLKMSSDARFAFVNLLGRATLWDVTTKAPVQNFGSDEHPIRVIALRPDARRVAVEPKAGESLKVESGQIARFSIATIMDVQSGREVRTLHTTSQWGQKEPHVTFYSTNAIAFSPDGTRIVTGTTETTAVPSGAKSESIQTGAALLWDADSGELLSRLQTPAPVENLEFSPHGDHLVAKSNDATCTVWHLPSSQKVLSVPHFSDRRVLPKITPDGRVLFSLSAEGAIVLWDVATSTELCRYMILNNGDDWLAVTPDGLFDGTEAGRNQVMFRIGGGLNVVPVDRFFQDFYYPGLLTAIWRGERPMPEVQLGHAAPPRLTITSPASGEVDTPQVVIAAQAIDRGGGVSGLAVFQNGARVLAEGETRREGDTVFRTFQLALVEGTNRIRVTAASGDGSWESEPAEIILNYARPLAKSRLHLVAVGVNQYTDAGMNLNFAAGDARALAELFSQRGGTLYEEVRVTQLLDAEATRDGIKQALREAAAATQPQDTLLLFLAGHGAMVGQRYYFVPHEFRRQAERLEDDLRAQGLPADELSEHLAEAAALKRIMILDTCASGGALGVALRARSFALRGAIERLSRNQGLFTIAAAAATAEAQESHELGHGVLSYALLAGLRGVNRGPLEDRSIQPTSPDRVVDVMEWFAFAAGQVPRLTERLYGAPQDVQTGAQGNSFPVLPLE